MEWAILLVFIVQTLACPSTDPTTIQIHNYDGPILLHIPAQNDEDCQNYPSYQQAEIQCTCIAKPSIKYVPINTASESSCCNRRNYGVYSGNGGSCTCGNNCGSCTCGTHCGTCTCGTNSGNGCRVCSCGNNSKHCRTCTCDTNTSENGETYKCGKCGGPCTYEANNSGICTCGSRNSGSCTCGSTNSGSETTNSEYNGESQFYNERSYKGIDKISYILDIVKPRNYESDYNNCICHKCPCY